MANLSSHIMFNDYLIAKDCTFAAFEPITHKDACGILRHRVNKLIDDIEISPRQLGGRRKFNVAIVITEGTLKETDA